MSAILYDHAVMAEAAGSQAAVVLPLETTRPFTFHSCSSIPLILFPVPLALRSYLRSSLVPNRSSPSLCTDPSLSLQAPAPSLLRARLLTQSLSHFHTHSRALSYTHTHTRVFPRTRSLPPSSLLPPPSRLSAVSFTSSTH